MGSVELVVGRRVVLTGAGGRIGRAIVPLLPAAWNVLHTDLKGSSEVAALDVTDPGRLSSGVRWSRRRGSPCRGS